jgi:hypothetical protein
MRAVDTPELRLVYIDPQETFLVPHAVRTFLNSIAFQRRVFGLDTKKPINVLLTDFQDAATLVRPLCRTTPSPSRSRRSVSRLKRSPATIG